MSITLVSFRGPIGSGKTTAAEYLCANYGFRRLSFAAPLKKLAARVTPDRGIDKARDRSLLQWLGTDYYRAMDPDHWVRAWEKKLMEVQELTVGECRVVVDDCRFPNELSKIRELGGHDFLLVPSPGVAWGNDDTHLSEAPLEITESTRHIFNTSALRYYYDQLDDLAEDVLLP